MALRRVLMSNGAIELLARGVNGAAPRAGRLAAAAAKPDAYLSTSSSSSSSSGAGPSGDAPVDERAKLASKLLYRARQRGFLELDLLVGLWAEAAVPGMDAPALRALEAVLDEENPDLFKWLTGQAPAPERLAANPQYAALKAHVDRQLSENLHSGAAAAAGRDWVRGWDDGNAAAATRSGAAATVGGESGSGSSGGAQ